MNKELIKQIMVKSGFDPVAIERMGIMPQAEKFAELLVKECAVVAHCNFHVDGVTLGGILKEHFGIEE